jgi:hypothetical protein
MGKTNWTQVFLGGLLAGVVFVVLWFVAWAIYLEKFWSPAMESLGHPVSASAGSNVFSIVFCLILGLLKLQAASSPQELSFRHQKRRK